MLGGPGTTNVFRLGGLEAGDLKDARWVVLMRSEGGAIVDTGSPALELDAEFRGTRLSPDHLEQLWAVEGRTVVDAGMWDELDGSGEVLPQSGDGVQGGRFDSFFTVLGVG